MKFEDYIAEEVFMLTEATFEHHDEDFPSGKLKHRHTFVGKKVGSTPSGHHVYAGKTTRVGSKHTQLAVHVVNKDTNHVMASHAPSQAHINNEKVHKAAIEHAKSTDTHWSDREPHKNFDNHHRSKGFLKKV